MKQMSVFDIKKESSRPLADRLRPSGFDDYFGQGHLVGKGRVLRRLIESDHIPSMIFWGPPGVGKTTLARIIAERTKADFINFSAVISGIKEIREVMKQAQANKFSGSDTIVFVDEIHRFNKAQQDAFLPFVEKGSIILIGATTENPSFEINNALLSRCKVFVMQALSESDVFKLLKRALTDKRGFGNSDVFISDEDLHTLAAFSNCDARVALSTLEMVVLNADMTVEETGKEKIVVTKEIIEQCISKKSLLYDKNGEEHYNLISALHKSMRNSDPDAAVYWLARMLEAGEDPLYVARRIVRFAAEDVGLADPRAVEITVACYQACHFLGMPECNVHLTQAVIYLSLSPKSNAMEAAYLKARADAIDSISDPVPLQIRNAPTNLMKELGYGKNYQYAHNYKEKMTGMYCLPEPLRDKEYYIPTEQGLEAKYKIRNEQIKAWKREERKKGGF